MIKPRACHTSPDQSAIDAESVTPADVESRRPIWAVEGMVHEDSLRFSHQLVLKPSIKQMAVALMSSVEVDRVRRIERLHEPRQIALRGLLQEMKVIRHQTKQQDPNLKIRDAQCQST